MPHWTTSPVTDSVNQYLSIAGEALQYHDPELWKTYVRRVGAENIRGVWSGDQLVGGLAFYRMGQWYGGKNISTAGVSGVAVDPAFRGSGACQALLVDFLKEMFRDGVPMASLYASTQRLYRSVGFEQSGHRLTYSLPMASLKYDTPSRPLPVTRFTEPSFEQLAEVAEQRARRNNGNLQRTPGLWERIIEPIDVTTTSYLIGDTAAPQGYIVLHHGTRAAGHPQALTASDWVANTPEALSRIIALVLDHRSMCDRFRWNGGPQDPLLLAAAEPGIQVQDYLRSLNRIIRFADALEARGYPPWIQGELHFSIQDELFPENQGDWILTIQNGEAKVTQGGLGKLKVDIRFATPLYTAFSSCSELVRCGHAVCEDPTQIHLADAIFAGPTPWTCELF